MGFHVDMAELLSHLETLSSDIKSTQADLWDAKTATNRIISTQALYGHAGQAVYHQLNNYDAALHVSLSDSLMLLSGEFSRTLSAFQSQVKETSATAILDEAYLHQLSQTLVQHQEKHASIERSIASIYGDIADLVSLSSPKSSYDECTDKANRVLTHTIEWVSAFDGASTSSQTQALLERDEAILSSLQGLGSLSYTDSRYSQFVSDAHFAKYVKQVDKQIQAKIKAAKQAQEKAAKVKELAWKKHHPVQSFIHDLEAGAIGWLDKDIKAHPNPLNRASAGFLKGAVELVSGLAEGGVNLTQVGLEELEVFGDMLQGNKPSQWKMADISGMLETEKQLARLALGTVTSNVFFDASIVLDGLPQRGNVGSIQKELRLDRQMSENFWQETSKSIAEVFKEDPAQATGCAVFEVGLLLFPWAKSGKLGETTKGAEMLNDVDKLSDGANLLQRLSKSTGFGDDLTAANQLKTFNQGLKGFSQAAKASLSKEALEDLGENLRNLTFQVPSQELALESAGTTGKIKSVGEFLDNAKVKVQRFSASTGDDVAKVGGELDEVGNVESKVGSVADDVATVANSPIKDMTSEEYEYYRVKSIVNPESDTMTLGKYRPSIDANGNLDWSVPGPDSYTVRAGDTTYFSLGSDWDKLTETYHLDKQGRQMFEAFNKPALDDAVTSGKSISFSHDPTLPQYKNSALDWEWTYLCEKYGYIDLDEIGGYWYASK